MAVNTPSSPHTSPHLLPAPVSTYIDRLAQRERLLRWIGAADRSGAIVGITGEPGIGKSALAREIAFELSRTSGAPVYFVRCGERALPAILRDCVAALRPLAPVADDDMALMQFKEALADARAIMVLDGLVDAGDVASLSTPGATVIVTSRLPMRIPAVALQTLGPDESLALLAGCAGVTEDDISLRGICALLAHHPLALSIMGACLRPGQAMPPRQTMMPGECLRWLSDEQNRLARSGLTGGALGLESALSFSYHRVSVPTQRVFRLLSVLPGPFDAGLAAAVSEDAPRAMAELVTRGLLRRENAGGGHAWLAAVRAFARARLANSERVAAEAKHALWVANRAGGVYEGLDALRPHIDAVFSRLQHERGAQSLKAARLLIQLHDALFEWLPTRLTVTEQIGWLRAVAGAQRAIDDERGEVGTLGFLASLHIAQGALDDALRCYERMRAVRNPAQPRSLQTVAAVAGGGAARFEHAHVPAVVAQAPRTIRGGARRAVPMVMSGA